MEFLNCRSGVTVALMLQLFFVFGDVQANTKSFSPADFDDDGVLNASDLDNDNDGILDTAEGRCVSNGLIEWNQYALGTDPDGLTPTDLDLTVTVRIEDPFGIENAFTNSIDDETTTGGEYAIELEQTPTSLAQYQLLTLTFSRALTGLSFIVRDVDKAPSNTRDDQLIIRGYSGGSVYNLTTSDFTLGTTHVFSGSNTFTGTSDNAQPAQDGNVAITFPVLIDSVQFEFSNSNPAVSGPQFLSIGDLTYTACASVDSDNDGTPDYRDTDSDNDGCPDALEAAGSFTSTDLQNDSLTGGVDANGIPNAVSPSGQAATADMIDSTTAAACTPIASNDTISFMEDTTNALIDVQVNDMDPNGDSLVTAITAAPTSGGAASVVNSDSIQYSPPAMFAGLDTIVYAVCDPSGACDTAIVLVTVVNVNDAPVATDDVGFAFEEVPTIINLTSNDNDPESNNLVISSILNGPDNGIVNIVTDSTVIYSPNTDFFGMDTFTYIVCDDGLPSLCDTAMTVVTVTNLNDAPTAVNDSITTVQDTVNVIIDVQSNDTDPDLHALTTTIVSGPSSGGTVSVVNADSLDYTPGAGFVGFDTIVYSVCDPGSFCDTALVLITIPGVNIAPVATDDAAGTFEELPAIVNLTSNDSDVNGNNLSVTATLNGPSNGIANIASDSTVVYSPSNDFFGTDTFSYIVCDNGLPPLCDTAQVIITVTNINDAPVATDDNMITTEDTTNVVIDVQANDIDAEGNTLTTSIVSGPTSGGSAMVLNGDSITYTPAALFNGLDTIIYSVCDAGPACDTAFVIVNVTGVNNAPVGASDAEATFEEVPGIFNLTSNDTDVDGNNLSITAFIDGPDHGIGNIVTDSTIIYAPDADFFGMDTFSYILCDDGFPSLCDTAEVIVTVTNINDAPVAVDDALAAIEDTVNVIINVQNNDSDVDGDALITSILNGPTSGGSASVLNGDSVDYTPAGGFNGLDTITYSICDPGSACDTALIIVSVGSVNDAPVAIDDALAVSEDTTNVIINVQANDNDPDGDVLTTTIVSAPFSGGTAIPVNSDSIDYTPAAGFSGLDTFIYSICDPGGACDTALVSINVISINAAPIAVDDIESTFEEIPTLFNLTGNDSDPNGDALSITATLNGPNNGIVNIVTDSTVLYLPDVNFFGTDSLTYVVCDDRLPALCDTAKLVVTVFNINDRPIAVNDTLAVDQDTTNVIIDVQQNDSDPDFHAVTTSIISPPTSGGGVSVVNGDSLDYSPPALFTGVDTIVYAICDPGSFCDTAMVIVTVLPVNSAPIAVDDNPVTTEDTANVILDVQNNDSDIDGGILTTSIITGPTSGGTAAVLNGDSIDYTPAAEYNGADTIVYAICDPQGACDTALVIVSVTAVNDAPVAVDDATSTPEETAVVFDVQGNDSDVDLDPFTTSILTGPANGSAGVLNNDSISYTPALNFNGNDTISYTIMDGNGGSDTAIFVISVTPVNDPPLAANDIDTTAASTPVVTDVQANDIDVDGDALTTTILVNPVNGTANVLNGDSISYNPNGGFNGNDTITYIVTDGNGGADTATLIVTVTGINNAPVAVDDAGNTFEELPGIINLTTNDADANGDNLTIAATLNGPSNGIVNIVTDSTIVYSPSTDFFGMDTFQYVVCDDGVPTLCDTAQVIITVTNINDAPVAVNDVDMTSEATSIVIDVQSNDSDVDGDALTTTILVGPVNGVANPVNGDSISYNPNGGFNGNDTITYIVSDGNGGADTATLIVTVTGTNNAPVALDDAGNTFEELPGIINLTTNDTDANGNNLSITATLNGPSNGIVNIVTDSTIVYSPATDFFGMDTFQYVVCDDGIPALCDTAQVIITVTNINDAPVAVNDLLMLSEDTMNAVLQPQVNDSDVDGDALTTSVINAPTSGGTATVLNGDSISYTPAASFTGLDTIVYAVCDPGTACDTAMIVIDIGNVNDAPVALDDAASTPEEMTVVYDVQINDFDADFDLLITAILNIPSNGSAAVLNGDSISYTPDTDFNGSDTITYVVSDGNGGSDTALLVIAVTPVADPPVAVNDYAVTNQDVSVLIPALGNDSDPENNINPFSPLLVVFPSLGTIDYDTLSGIVTYNPTPGVFGIDTMVYSICDSTFLCDTAIIVVVINDVDYPPVAINDVDSVLEDSVVVISVLSNDTDADNNINPGSVSILSGPANGMVSVNPVNGQITYTPGPNYIGTDLLTYAVCDSTLLCDTAFVTIEVLPVSDRPDAIEDTQTTNEDVPITVDVLVNDSDQENNINPGSVTVLAPPSDGNTIVNPTTGEITYLPDANINGVDYFTYIVCDSTFLCDTSSVTINITPVPDAPVALDDPVTGNEDTVTKIDVLLNDTDVEGNINPSTVAGITPPANGMITVDTLSGVITYTPDPNFSGMDTFTYQVCDSTLLCDTAQVWITILPVAEAPVAVADTAAVQEDSSALIDVLANDSDQDDNIDPSGVALLLPSSNGTTTVNPVSGAILYTPDPDYFGTDNFSYVVCDSTLLCDTTTVTVDITAVDDAPVALADNAVTAQDSVVVIDVVANDQDADNNIDPGSVSTITAPGNGLVSIDPLTGALTYTPNNGYQGTDTLVYAICDSTLLCDTALVTVFVSDAIDPPTALKDTAIVIEDSMVVIDVLSNDVDIDNNINPANVQQWQAPGNGITSIDPVTGEITYTPDPDYNGLDSFAYIVCDSTLLCDTAIVFIEVTPVADAPVAIDDAAGTDQDSAVAINVLANDSDVEGDINPSAVNEVDAPVNGTTMVDPVTGIITYTPGALFTGIDSFTYVVCDSTLLCDTAVVTISVDPVSNPPVAAHDTVVIDEDSTVLIDVLVNDSDPQGNIDPSSVDGILLPLNGQISIDAISGVITYVPDQDYFGVDSFSYAVCDSSLLCDTATVRVWILSVPDAPTATDDSTSTIQNQAVIVDVLINDLDADGNLNAGSVSELQTPANGITSVDPVTGAITYIPNTGFNGMDDFTYVVCDSTLLCDTALVTVVVDPSNTAPVALNDTASTTQGQPVLVSVLDNDIDSEDNIDPSSVVEIIAPVNGSTVVDPLTGVITYTPDVSYSGADSFAYAACDSGMPPLCDTAWVTITVVPSAANSPQALNDSITVTEDSIVTISVMSNDSDMDNNIDASTVSELVPPVNGGITIDPQTGAVTYTPGMNFFGLDSFSYIICDSTFLCDTAMVWITVSPVNDAPVANDDSAQVTTGDTVVIDVLVNDTDIEGSIDASSVDALVPPSNGTVSVNATSGELTYIPDSGYSGTDTVWYTVCDSGSPVLCDTGTLVVFVDTIPRINRPPVAAMDMILMTAAQPFELDVLDNDSDPDGDSIAVTGFADQPEHGTVEINPDGSITYTAIVGFAGIDQFAYIVCDDGQPALCDTALVTVTVIGLVANDDAASTSSASTVNVPILQNDDLPDGIDTSIVFLVNPAVGSAIINPDGSVTYTPDPNGNGIDSFQYQVCVAVDSGIFACHEAWVQIDVYPQPVTFPNGFSPNNDGINDFFGILGLQAYPRATLNVYNRYGDEVWNSAGPYNNDWGGTNFNGKPLPDGTYYYIIEFNDGKTEPATMFVQLHRGTRN